MKTTQLFSKSIVVLAVLNLCAACARPGIPDESSPAKQETARTADGVNGDDDRLTRVGFDLYPDLRWRYPVCDELDSAPVSGREAPQIDGDLSDWEARPFRISDPIGDDTQGRDITSVAIDLVSGGDLYLAIASALNTGDELHVELGVMSATGDGTYVEKSLRYLRFANGALQWWQDGTWQVLPGNDLGEAVAGSAVEMRLTRIFVGELLAYPVWFVKVSSRAGDRLNDIVSAAYLPGAATGFEQRLSLKSCRIGNYRVTLLKDRAASNEMAEEFFRIARLAVSRFTETWGPAGLEMTDATFFIGGSDLSVAREALDGLAVEQDHFVQWYPLPRQWTDSADPTLRSTLFRKIVTTLAERNFAAAAPQLSPSLRRAASKAWSLPLLGSDLGKQAYLASYWEDVAPFLVGGDEASQVKTFAWAHILDAFLPQSALLSAWQDCQTCDDDQMYHERLVAVLSDGEKATAEKVWLGWRNDQPYDPDFTPDLLQDADGDGLPTFLENKLGLAVDLVDTDKDGWSDYAEWLFETDGRNSLVHPTSLSVDGLLGDWRDLMPTRIKADPDTSTEECGSAGAIEHFAALADRDAIIVVAQVRETSLSGTPVSLEVVFDFPEERRKFQIQAESGARYWRVQEEKGLVKTYAASYANGSQGFEMVFRASDFGLNRDLRDNQVVNMRMRTSVMRTSQLHCDDTPWFRPLIRDNRP